MTPIVAAGVAHTDALWFTLALECAASMHYRADAVPPVILEKLQQLRSAAEEFASAADYIGALLVAEGVEGVSTDTSELVITLDEDDEDDLDGEEWVS